MKIVLSSCLAAALATAGLAVGPAPSASAAQPQPDVVEAASSAVTPRLVATSAVPQPHVDALAGLGSTMFAGGAFDTVEEGGRQDLRHHLMAFDRVSGALRTGFDPVMSGGQVWALATDPSTNSVYVGGKFTSIDGVSRGALAKLNATTGALDTSFRPPFNGGQINDLELVEVGGTKHLVIAGTPSRRVMSLNPATGRDDGWITTQVTDQLPGSWGTAAGYQLAVDPSRTHLAVTGNFSTVDGQPRSKFFMLDLAPASTSLSDWYYPGFAKPCATNAPRRIASLQGVDFSPDGTALTVTATGQIPEKPEDIWYHRLGDNNRPNTSVCDAVGRFSLSDDTKPDWINYTGGDSVWTAADTGSAVYVAGHFKWLDNADGYGSIGIGDKTSEQPAVARRGIGAIDPVTGRALPWNPGLTATRIGGKAFLADAAGLWIGNDATQFKGAPRLGLQFAPLPEPAVPARPDQVVWAVGEACDPVTGPAAPACAGVGALIDADPETTAVLGLGDLQGARGSLADYQGTYDSALGSGAGLFSQTLPVPGEMDYLTSNASGFFDYWGTRAGQRGQGWSATEAGAWTLVGANSNCNRIGNCTPTGPQGTFMTEELRDPATSCELVFTHHPVFSDGVKGDQAWGRTMMASAYANNADLVVAGHETGYQRFAARAPDGTPSAARGVPTFVVGTGGRPATEWRSTAQRSEFRQNDRLGALRLVLSEDAWTAEFVAVGGQVLDTSSGSCRG